MARWRFESGNGYALLALCAAACSAPTGRGDGPSPGLGGGAAATLRSGGVVDCPDPARRDLVGPWERSTLPAQTQPLLQLDGGGMAIADLDGDELPDLFFPGHTTPQLWLQAADGTWRDAVDQLPAVDLGDATGASAADYDGDGDFDLFVTRDRAADVLLRNEGGSFVDVTAEAGFDDRAWRSMSSAWVDWDGDGDLDLTVASYHREEPNVFWENQGEGTFEEVFLLSEVWTDGLTFFVAWHDLEGDGYPDLFLMNDLPQNGAPTAIFANRGGVLTQDASCGYPTGWDGMGVVVTDIDGDLVPDIAATSFRSVGLHLGLPSEGADQGVIFANATAAWGLAADRAAAGQGFGWGIDAGDLDLDGDTDLVATWGYWTAGNRDLVEQPDSVWYREGETFVEEPPHDFGAGRGSLLVDLDGDGHLDLVKRHLQEPSTIDRSVCGEGTWVTVQVRDVPDSLNQFGVGVRVLVEAGGASYVRWIDAGSRSMFASAPPEVHVGLAGAATIDRLEVSWPDGRVSTFRDVPARQQLTVEMHEGAAPR